MNEDGQDKGEERQQAMAEEHCSAAAENSKTAKSIGVPPPLYDAEETGPYTMRETTHTPKSPAPSYSEFPIPAVDYPTASREVRTILPSYSTVMRSPPKGEKSLERFEIPSAPPTYSEVPGVYMIPSSGHLFGIQNLGEPLWRSCSQTAYCHRCDTTVVTMTRTHESMVTHIAALALCLFGCWPCCLLPYCLNACKNTYHLCPICKGYLGAYTPW